MIIIVIERINIYIFFYSFLGYFEFIIFIDKKGRIMELEVCKYIK